MMLRLSPPTAVLIHVDKTVATLKIQHVCVCLLRIWANRFPLVTAHAVLNSDWLAALINSQKLAVVCFPRESKET